MNEESEQLLEAHWEGRLDADGRARLETLATADPALAERLADERRIDGLFRAIGPSRPRRDLAASVFARLDSEAATEAELDDEPQPEPAPSPRPVRNLPERGSIWSWLMPTLRWGGGFALAAALVAEGFILFHQNRKSDTPSRIAAGRAPEGTVPQDRQIAMATPAPAPRLRSTQPPRQATATPPANPEPATAAAIRSGGRTSSDLATPVVPIAPETSPEPTPAPAAPAETMLAMAPKTTPAPTPTPEPSPEAAAPDILTVEVPQPVATPTPPAERALAMRIVLSPDSAALSPGGGASGGGMPDLATGFAGSRNTLAGRIGRALAGGESGARGGAPSPAPDFQKLPTRRDIEMALATAGGTIDALAPLPGQPGVWQERCSLSGDQLDQFLEALRGLGLRPGTIQGLRAARSGARPTTPAADNPTGIERGGTSLSRFEQLRQMGIDVQIDGGGPQAPAGASAKALSPEPEALAGSLAPGHFALLEDGAPLVGNRPSSAGQTAEAAAALPSFSPTAKVHLTLLIQQP